MGIQKRKIGESFFGKKHRKIAHGQKFAPKIFPAYEKFIIEVKQNSYIGIEDLVNISCIPMFREYFLVGEDPKDFICY